MLTLYPTRISMTDFLAHEATEVDLTGVRSAVITGPVGSGKTSIIEALTWALYGEARGRTLDQLVREGGERASVTVDLMAEGVPLSVVRSKPVGKPGTLSLRVGSDDWGNGTQHTSTETQAEVIRRIGVSYDAMLAGPLMVQSDRGALMNVDPRKRRDLLLSLLVDTERWERWTAEASRLAREADRAHAVSSRMADAQDIPMRIASGRLTAEGHEASVARMAGHVETAERYRVEMADALGKARADAARGEAAIQRYETCRESFQTARNASIEAETNLLARAGSVQWLLDKAPPEAPAPGAMPEELREALRHAERAGRTADVALMEARSKVREAEAALARAQSGESVTCPDCGRVFVPGSDPDRVEHAQASVTAHRATIAPMEAVREECEREIAEATRVLEAADAAVRAGTTAWKVRVDWEHALALAKQHESAAHRTANDARERARLASEAGKSAKAEWEQYRDVTAALNKAIEAESEAGYAARNAQRVLASEQSALAVLRERIVEWEAALQEAERHAVLAREWQDKAVVATTLEKAFGPTGVPSMMLDGAIPAIEDAANDVLARMPGGFRLMLRTQRATGKNTLVDAVDVVVDPGTGGERDYDLLSGGQRFRVDLALRMGLTRVLSAGRVQTLILDEGLDRWQDPEGRGAVMDALMSVADDFRLVLVCSHHPEVIERFSTRIAVTKGMDNVSRVTIE